MQKSISDRVNQVEGILVGLHRELASLRADASTPEFSGSRPSISLSPDGKIAMGSHGLEIAYRGSNTCPYGKSATSRKQDFAAIVVHHTSPKHSTDWYVQYQIDGDPVRGGHFGYHFYISPDGEIIQGAPLTKRTNHVKPSKHLKRNNFGRDANNRNAIGITCSGAGTPDFKPTSQQLTSLRALSYALCQVYQISFSDIYGHGEIQSDRNSTEGRDIAAEMRDWIDATDATAGSPDFIDDDLDDSPIFMMGTGAKNEVYTNWPNSSETPDQYIFASEDDDDEGLQAILGGITTGADKSPVTATATELKYVNQNAIRNKSCTSNIERRLVEAVEAVYGSGCTINIYSGGQDRKGLGDRRTGSIRHDDYGNGGRAADVHVFNQNGQQVKGVALAKLGQYWLASNFGCVGHEMRGGGIHLDEWTTPPPGGGRLWTYAYSQNLPWSGEATRMLEDGARGIFP